MSRASGLSGQQWCHQTGNIFREKERKVKQSRFVKKQTKKKIQYLQVTIMKWRIKSLFSENPSLTF